MAQATQQGVKQFVVGLLFDSTGQHVLLIKKTHPSWQADDWNGPGGRVEAGETSLDAVRREFYEETSVWVQNWVLFARLQAVRDDEPRVIHFFYAFDSGALDSAAEATRPERSEVTRVHCALHLPDNLVTGTRWAVAMASEHADVRVLSNAATYYVVTEKYA